MKKAYNGGKKNKKNKKNKKSKILEKYKISKIKSSTDILKSIKSDYALANIFNYINLNQKLKIVKESKSLQKRLKIGIHYYIFNKIYYKLEKGEKLNIDFNGNHDHEDIMYYINRERRFWIDEKTSKKILIDFFNDIYNQYYKDYIIVNYRFPTACIYIPHYFNFLVSLNCPIKICVGVPIDAFIEEISFDHSYNDSALFKDLQEIALETFDFDKNVFGFDFFYGLEKELYWDIYGDEFFLVSFLNKINKKFEDLEYVRIHSHLLNSLINRDKIKFFEKNFKKFEIYNENESYFIKFIENIDKIKSNLKTEELKIILLDEKTKQIGKLDLSNINIKKLELKGIYNIKKPIDSYCILDDKTIKNLESLVIYKTPIFFKEMDNVIFPNLNTLNISGIDFGKIFKKNVLLNNNTFPKISHLTLEIISIFDYLYITQILEYSKLTLIELNLLANFDSDIKKEKNEHSHENDDNNSDNDDDNDNNSDNDNIINDNIINDNNDNNDNNEKDKGEVDYSTVEDLYVKLSNAILDLKNLKYLRINNFFSFYNFIDIILTKYKSDKLIEFKSNCIKLIDAKTFIKNNNNLKIIDLV